MPGDLSGWRPDGKGWSASEVGMKVLMNLTFPVLRALSMKR
jgi:hypothetical protein